ncbi:MAG: peptigoglycan-binding protein LysM [Hyphomicrobiales bacterium]|nr:MAG: peptigoglycan-binding protein LysM [Hyphomicrobiales bacterium]
MAGWVKALLFLLGGVTAAAGTAYVTGLLDPWLAPRPAAVAPEASAPETPAPETPAPGPARQPAGDGEAAPGEAQKAGDPVTTAKQGRLVPPVFDILRVEPDGSVLVAGKAGSKAAVEVLSGETVLGAATAGEEGDFVVVLDEPLAPGDYRITLRATAPGAEAVLSAGTAIVSVPEAEDGQVLAMVEEPGAPAQLITVPQAGDDAGAAARQDESAGGEAAAGTGDAPAEPATQQAGTPAEPEADAAAQQPGEAAVAAAPQAGEDEPAAPADQQLPAAAHTVAVEAVEIEGDTIFVAGRAEPGRTVRVYADALHLGDAVASDGGRFLVEAKRELAVGNYLIRADLLDKDGAVLARAAVPFEREPGETIAAVAPATPAPAAPADTDDAAAAPQAGTAQEAEADAADAGAPGGEAQAGAQVAVAPAAPAAGGEAATAPPLQRVDGAVIIRRGDSLWRISRRVYGHGIRYSTIYLANQDQIRNPDRIWPGQVFTVPHETPEGERADLDAIGDQAVMPQDRQPADE